MFDVKNILEQQKISGSAIIFIRHAEKQKSNSIEQSFKVGITSDGYNAAVKFGAYLRNKFGSIFEIKTSPVKRCIDTSRAIVLGLQQDFSIIKHSTKLGDPGVYICDDKIALQNFLNTEDIYIIVKQYLKKNILPGMAEVSKGTNILLTEILEDLQTNSGIKIYISHDVIIATFISFLCNMQINKDNFIDFLDGAILTKNVENKDSIKINLKKR